MGKRKKRLAVAAICERCGIGERKRYPDGERAIVSPPTLLARAIHPGATGACIRCVSAGYRPEWATAVGGAEPELALYLLYLELTPAEQAEIIAGLRAELGKKGRRAA